MVKVNQRFGGCCVCLSYPVMSTHFNSIAFKIVQYNFMFDVLTISVKFVYLNLLNDCPPAMVVLNLISKSSVFWVNTV